MGKDPVAVLMVVERKQLFVDLRIWADNSLPGILSVDSRRISVLSGGAVFLGILTC